MVRRALDRMVRQRLFLCEDADPEQKRLYANGVALGVPAPRAGLPAPTALPHCSSRSDRSDDDEGDDGDRVDGRQ
jgi:hypothetical protein